MPSLLDWENSATLLPSDPIQPMRVTTYEIHLLHIAGISAVLFLRFIRIIASWNLARYHPVALVMQWHPSSTWHLVSRFWHPHGYPRSIRSKASARANRKIWTTCCTRIQYFQGLPSRYTLNRRCSTWGQNGGVVTMVRQTCEYFQRHESWWAHDRTLDMRALF